MDDKTEIYPTRWSRIKLVIGGLFIAPAFGFVVWMDPLPVFVRLLAAIVFVPMLVATPLLIIGLFTNRPSYVVSNEGIEIKSIGGLKHIPWSNINDIEFLDLSPFSRPIGKSDAYGNLAVRILLKNSSFWNRGPTLTVGEANISPNEVIVIIASHFQKSRLSTSQI